MSGTRLVVAALAATLVPVPAATAQVERVWLTHRTADPSKLVVNWTTRMPGGSKVRFGPTKDYGREAHIPGSRTLHHVEIPLTAGAALHYSVSTGGQTSSDATFKGYQAGTTLIRVLTPEKVEKDRKYPVVYVLPVEAGTEDRYGDGLKEVKKLGLHDKLGAVFVAPTFSHLPWYADHPTRKDVRQETYFLHVVVPFVEKTYPVHGEPRGRLLIGFSKSGWGAYSLLLRHPDVFGRAAAWDAPLAMDKPGKYGSGDVFGTPENFAGYRVTKLLESRAKEFRKDRRLILLGYGNFRDHHRTAHELMEKLKVAHEYRDGPARNHDWHSGWVTEAVELLLSDRKDGPSA